jgi:CO/xanthine dehydrogenase FAD-binding subunit
MKECARRGIDFATGSIAAAVTEAGGACAEPYLVLGALGSAPLVLQKTAALLQHARLTDALIDEAARTARSEPGILTNLFTSAGYKRDLAQALVRKALSAHRAMFFKTGRAAS